jgi:hypothetical protein
MDGRNRLFTIYYFLKGDISFENEEDETISYSNMSPSEQRKLNSTNISYTETRDWTKEQCQEFFMNIQSGEKLKNGELIHAKPDNPLTIEIQHIYPYFEALFTNKCSDSGIGLSKACIKRYGHYEIIGTLLHMVRTSEYPVRPGKTAFQEFKDWGNENPEFSLLLPSEWTRDTCVTETKSLLHKYSTILQSVPRSRTGMKLTNHLRLLYFIYKSDIYHNDLNEEIYSKIENLLTRVMNKDDEAYDKIVKLGTGGVDRIYDLYYEIYNY